MHGRHRTFCRVGQVPPAEDGDHDPSYGSLGTAGTIVLQAAYPHEEVSMSTSFSGGCACGAIRYECSAEPVAMLNCHCRDCQRASGGGSTPVVAVPAAAFALRKGEPRYHETRGDAGHLARRGFCAQCGSPLVASGSRMPGIIVLKVASLDDPSWFKPMADIWMVSVQPWEPVDPGLPKIPKDLPPRG